MLDGAILSGRIHGLKNQQDRMLVCSVLQLLQFAEFCHLFCQAFFIVEPRIAGRCDPCWPLFKVDFFAFLDLVGFGLDLQLCADWAAAAMALLRRFHRHTFAQDAPGLGAAGDVALGKDPRFASLTIVTCVRLAAPQRVR